MISTIPISCIIYSSVVSPAQAAVLTMKLGNKFFIFSYRIRQLDCLFQLDYYNWTILIGLLQLDYYNWTITVGLYH